MKAREVKRAKLANRYAHKREEIAAKVKSGEMDHEEAWQALCEAAPQLESDPSAQPLQDHRPSQRLHPPVRHQPYPVPRDGLEGTDPGRYEGQLVIFRGVYPRKIKCKNREWRIKNYFPILQRGLCVPRVHSSWQ